MGYWAVAGVDVLRCLYIILASRLLIEEIEDFDALLKRLRDHELNKSGLCC